VKITQKTVYTYSMEKIEERTESFRYFTKNGGKFRVSIVNVCNLSCSFCHNEAMQNPRTEKLSISSVLSLERILEIIHSYISLGAKQINITGGEPLLHPQFFEFISKIEKGNCKLVINTNAIQPKVLLENGKIEKIDSLLISLHTLEETVFKSHLGKSSSARVQENILKLQKAGYHIEINCSLGNYNKDGLEKVIRFASENRIDLKIITLVRHNEKTDFYSGDWISPDFILPILKDYGFILLNSENSLGGYKMFYKNENISLTIKDIGKGKLFTSFCTECQHKNFCGEGIYGLRVGVDGLWKPCLLNKEKFVPISESEPMQDQILNLIHQMIGEVEFRKYNMEVPC
jgi:molybdenum cofactor biosynthesis enzyme MoaA